MQRSLLSYYSRKESNEMPVAKKPRKEKEIEVRDEVQDLSNVMEEKSSGGNTSDDTAGTGSSDDEATETASTKLPSCWTEEQGNYFQEKNPWLIAKNGKLGCHVCNSIGRLGLNHHLKGSRLAAEWANSTVESKSEQRQAQVTALRKKIWIHKESAGHKDAEEIMKKSKAGLLETHFQKQNADNEETTNCIFRTAYMIGKGQHAFSDMPDLLDLQTQNGINLGIVLQSRKSCADICEFIGVEMRKKMVKHIMEEDLKIGVLIDESTTVSHQTVLIVCLRTVFSSSPTTVFFDLVELEDATANAITFKLLECLRQHFSEDFLKKNWISFTSDGASTMIGRVSGVATQLKEPELYPDLVVWHCCNHRLELAVGDTIKEATGVNNFKAFLDKLYSLYHASPKNQRELHLCAEELSVIFLKIGRVLGIRWVASSERTVKAVWQQYPALHAHFQAAATDPRRDGKEQSKYRGLDERLTATAFVSNLGLMRDALAELAELSLKLQSNSITLPEAHTVICRKIKVFESWAARRPGEFSSISLEATEKLEFKGVVLHSGRKVDVAIKREQFFSSLADSLRKRLMTTAASNVSSRSVTTSVSDYEDFISVCKVVYPQNWPDDYDVLFGEPEVVSMCRKFHLPSRQIILGFREYKDNGGREIPEDMKPLITGLDTIAVSTAECERGFSSMNTTMTPLRNSLGIVRLSSILFLNRNGPPLPQFKPQSYVRSWLSSGQRSANHLACRKKEHGNSEKKPCGICSEENMNRREHEQMRT